MQKVDSRSLHKLVEIQVGDRMDCVDSQQFHSLEVVQTFVSVVDCRTDSSREGELASV